MSGKQWYLDEKQLCDLLVKKNFQQILTWLKDEQNQSAIQKDGMTLVSALCSTLREYKEIFQEPSDFDFCSQILNLFVEKGNAKEVLLSLLEAAEYFEREQYFQLLLTPIQKVMMRIPGKRGKSLEWVLSILNNHLVSLPPPDNHDLEDKELLLMDLDPKVQEVAYSLSGYMKFLHPFVEEVSIHSLGKKTVFYSDRILNQREILQKYLLKLLDKPLIYHDLHWQSDVQQSLIQSLCYKVLSHLADICKNFFSLSKHSFCYSSSSNALVGDMHEDKHMDGVSPLAFANLAYLMFAENLFPECRPYVYSHVFLLEKHLPLITCLLGQKQNLVVYKGLQLCKVLLKNLSEFVLPGYMLCHDKYLNLSKALWNIAVFCPVENYRSMSVMIFQNYITKFTWQVRYNHLMHILNSNSHSGVQGFIIGIYKGFLHDSLNGKGDLSYFSGAHFKAFIRQAISLKNVLETDILEEYDKIISTLNFLRFVVLRDCKEENVTGIWDLIESLTNNYLEPLHKGIEISKAHYELQAKLLKEGKPSKSSVNETVTANGKILPNIPPDYQLEVIEKAIVSLDVVESILTRLKELL